MTTSEPQSPLPRAFTQGVGTVFQGVGVTLFLLSMLVCCGSSFFSGSAIRKDLTHVGWGHYSVQMGMTVFLAVAVFSGLALAVLGLGLQATHRRTPVACIGLTVFVYGFDLVHSYFFFMFAASWVLTIIAGGLAIVFFMLFALSIAAWKDMRQSPLAMGFEILPADYQVPYSHLHKDPPEVRFAQELQERRQRLEIQQKELEALEERIKRHSPKKDGDS